MANTSWACLFDQADAVKEHTSKGIDFLDKFASFAKERQSIEEEYANKIKSLIKKHQPKKKEEPEYQFSYAQAFLKILDEHNCLANQHEIIAEQLKTNVCAAAINKCKELRDNRVKALQDIGHLEKQMDLARDSMLKARKEYVDAWKKAQAAHMKHMKADSNMDLSRAEVEKTKNQSMVKRQAAEDAKNAYALATQRANDQQRNHYNAYLPGALEKLRGLDEERIEFNKQLLDRMADVDKQALPIISKCLDDMRLHSSTINKDADSSLVIQKYRTGYAPPTDFVFEDFGPPDRSDGQMPNTLDHSDAGSHNGHDAIAVSKNRTGTLGRRQSSNRGIGKIFGTSKAGDTSMMDDYSDLAPQQRKQKLDKKIRQCEKDIDTKQKERDGALRMLDVYRGNPKLGDPRTVEQEIGRQAADIDKLNQQLIRYRRWLADAESHINAPINGTTPRGPPPSYHASMRQADTNSIQSADGSTVSSEGSRHHMAPSSAMATNQRLAPSVARGGTSPESGIAVAVHDDVYNEADELPVMGTATVLYAFPGDSDGTIRLNEDETVLLVEKDEGDGWTRVRKAKTHEEGFAPTSYLDCKWYPD